MAYSQLWGQGKKTNPQRLSPDIRLGQACEQLQLLPHGYFWLHTLQRKRNLWNSTEKKPISMFLSSPSPLQTSWTTHAKSLKMPPAKDCCVTADLGQRILITNNDKQNLRSKTFPWHLKWTWKGRYFVQTHKYSSSCHRSEFVTSCYMSDWKGGKKPNWKWITKSKLKEMQNSTTRGKPHWSKPKSFHHCRSILC